MKRFNRLIKKLINQDWVFNKIKTVKDERLLYHTMSLDFYIVLVDGDPKRINTKLLQDGSTRDRPLICMQHLIAAYQQDFCNQTALIDLIPHFYVPDDFQRKLAPISRNILLSELAHGLSEDSPIVLIEKDAFMQFENTEELVQTLTELVINLKRLANDSSQTIFSSSELLQTFQESADFYLREKTMKLRLKRMLNRCS